MADRGSIVAALDQVIHDHVRQHFGDPALLLVGTGDVPWLLRELNHRLMVVDPKKPMQTRYCGIELRRIDHANGVFAVGKQLAQQLIEIGTARPL